jgi:peptidoglycan biosynthesis protein MviN/MurJ (putative lipid II flippase)
MIVVVLVFLMMLYQVVSSWPWYRTIQFYGAPPWAEIVFNIVCIFYLRMSRRLKATLHLEQPQANAKSAS